MRTKRVPVRTCLSCGEKQPQRDLVRFVRTPEGRIEIDFKGHKPGRGAYLCRKEGCWTRGMEKGVLDRVLRTAISSNARDGLQTQYMKWQEIAAGNEAP